MNANQPHASQTPHSVDEEPQTLSLLGGVAKQDELTEAERLELEAGSGGARNVFGQGAILIAVVVLVAGGVLYGMRLAQGELTTGVNRQVEARVEATLARLTQPQAMQADDPLAQDNLRELFEDTDAIVAMFATDRTASQVPINYVQKNPFTLHTPVAKVEEATERKGPSEEELRAQRRVQLEGEIQNMRLQSVMGGRTPIAIINNEFLREGQEFGSFTVKQISAERLTVILEHQGERFTLSMQN